MNVTLTPGSCIGSSAMTNGSNGGTPSSGRPFEKSGMASWVAFTRQDESDVLHGCMKSAETGKKKFR